MAKMIPYSRQMISQDDIDSVVEVLKSDFLTQGSMVPIFEQNVCQKVGAKYGIAVNSATSALHVACLALGLTEKDYLWTSANTFVASANCGLYCGASIDFVDIDKDSYNISINDLKNKLHDAEKNNKLPKILVAVDFSGQSCDMLEISELSKKYGFKIIEDASHAIGGEYLGNPIGSCKFSDITVFSFHPVKIITTGEGGMAMTNDSKLAELMNQYRSHGITRNKDFMMKKNSKPYHYEQITLGYNYRMNDIMAGLGISQLKNLSSFVEARNTIAQKYDRHLKNLPIKLPKINSNCHSSFHLYVIRLQTKKTNITYDEFFNSLREFGIGVNLHYEPVHLHPFYLQMGFKEGDFTEAEIFSKQAISLPVYASLTNDEQNFVIEKVTSLLS